MPHQKWEGLLFTPGLLHSFTLVKVEEAYLAGWAFLHLVKFYSSHLKIVMSRSELALLQLSITVSANFFYSMFLVKLRVTFVYFFSLH